MVSFGDSFSGTQFSHFFIEVIMFLIEILSTGYLGSCFVLPFIGLIFKKKKKLEKNGIRNYVHFFSFRDLTWRMV